MLIFLSAFTVGKGRPLENESQSDTSYQMTKIPWNCYDDEDCPETIDAEDDVDFDFESDDFAVHDDDDFVLDDDSDNGDHIVQSNTDGNVDELFSYQPNNIREETVNNKQDYIFF